MTVEQIQCLLTYLGYNPGAVDGVNGLKTAAAVLVFQQQEGLRRDGVPGPETQEALLSAVALGVPVSVVDGGGSGVRCAAHNAEVGGVANSQHLFGLAADLHSAASPAEMKAAAEEVLGHTGGIGLYGWGIHVDTRQGYARWKG